MNPGSRTEINLSETHLPPTCTEDGSPSAMVRLNITKVTYPNGLGMEQREIGQTPGFKFTADKPPTGLPDYHTENLSEAKPDEIGGAMLKRISLLQKAGYKLDLSPDFTDRIERCPNEIAQQALQDVYYKLSGTTLKTLGGSVENWGELNETPVESANIN